MCDQSLLFRLCFVRQNRGYHDVHRVKKGLTGACGLLEPANQQAPVQFFLLFHVAQASTRRQATLKVEN